MIMAPTMPLNVYCMALLTCIMRDHKLQLLKYIIQFNIISLTLWLFVIFIYIIDKIYINSIDAENVTNQTCTATDYRPSYHGNRKRDTSLRMIDFARTVQNFWSSCF